MEYCLLVSYHIKAILVFGMLTILAALQLSPTAATQQSVTDFVYIICNTVILTTNDTIFFGNLVKVTSSLMQDSSRVRYSLASSATNYSETKSVYGMYQCRGDISLSDCADCVMTGFSWLQTVSYCGSPSIGVRAQFTGCFLRYESYVFSDSFDMQLAAGPTCSGSANDFSPLYKQNLGSELKESAIAAPQHPLFSYNASSVGSGSDTAYALTQCLGDLS